MIVLLRRFLVFQAFLIWQGGFLFYAAVVVPIGTEVLGGAFEQGRVTQSVTVWLNFFGVIWHPLVAWDAVATRPFRRIRLRMIWISAAILYGMVILHSYLDGFLDPNLRWIPNEARADFYRAHSVYIWASAAQWVLGLISAGLTLAAWRKRDREGY